MPNLPGKTPGSRKLSCLVALYDLFYARYLEP
jgi:hypothetical protein